MRPHHSAVEAVANATVCLSMLALMVAGELSTIQDREETRQTLHYAVGSWTT